MVENHQLSQFVSLSFQDSVLYYSYYSSFFLYCYFIISDYIWAVNVWGWSCLWQWKVSQKRLRITIWETLVLLWHKILDTGLEEHDIISNFDMIHDIIRVTWDTLLWHDIAKIWQKLYLSITITRWNDHFNSKWVFKFCVKIFAMKRRTLQTQVYSPHPLLTTPVLSQSLDPGRTLKQVWSEI